MKAFKVFILGMLYGCIAKFIIDRIYRENKIEDLQNENISLKEHIGSLERKLHSKPLESQPVTGTAAPTKRARIGTGKNDLKQIKGIGPAAERKLKDAGINTFAGVAQLTIAELQNIIGASKRVTDQAGKMISEAKKLAKGKDK